MKFIVIALVSSVAAVIAPGAVTAAAPAGQVESLRLDPAAASHGAAIEATVEVTNPGDKRSKKLNLLLKLRAPDGESGLLLASKRVGKLGAGESRNVELTASIPDDAPSGDSTLVACRAKKDSGDACGVSRQQAPLRVLTPARFVISPGAHAFESHATGTTSPTRTFTVTNTGETASQPIATSITGADPNQFTKSADGCDGQALAAGQSCEVNAAFTPATTGVKSGGLRASTSASSATAALTGTGIAPANLTISPSPHGFGTHATGSTSGAQTFTVTNTGGVPSGTIATSVAGADPGQFTKSADNCNGQTLAAGASCTVNTAFAPTSSGAKSASLDASATPGGTASAALTGTGQTPAQLEITPASWDFGTVVQGNQSAVKTFTVANTGEQPTGNPVTISRSGAQGTQFSITSTTCGAALAGGATCTIDLRWDPTAPFTGDPDANLAVSASPGGSDSATLNGNAITPANLTITPTDHDFGNVLQGTESPTQTLTVTNTGQQTAELSSFAISPPGAVVPFAFGFPSCHVGTQLAHLASCEITVYFRPGASDTGPFDATLTVNGSPGGSDSATVEGNAVTTAANLTISPPTFSSGGPFPPNAQQSVPITVTNTGAADARQLTFNASVNNANLTVSTAFAPPFGGIPGCGTVLPGGQECVVYLGLLANGSGAATWDASLQITGTPGGTQTFHWTE